MGNDGKNYIKLDKGSNGIFEKSIEIKGSQVKLSVLINNLYYSTC